jgi:hypothetical protein
MTFTGTLIEDLMATVERAEQRAQFDEASTVDQMFANPMFVMESQSEPWLASVRQNTEYDSKLLGVA